MLDAAVIQYEHNIYVEGPVISHSVEVSDFPGLVQPPSLLFLQYTLLRLQ